MEDLIYQETFEAKEAKCECGEPLLFKLQGHNAEPFPHIIRIIVGCKKCKIEDVKQRYFM